PHEYDPSKDTDYSVDFLNVLSTNENTDDVDKIKELSEEYTEELNSGITHLSKLEEFEGSIKNSKIEFTRQEVETVLKDYKINLTKIYCNFYEYIVKLDNYKIIL